MWTIGIVILAFASGVLAQSCGTTREVFVGLADATVFPWVGVVYYRGPNVLERWNGSATATGVLIDKQHVLMSDSLNSLSKDEELHVQFGVIDLKDAWMHHNYSVEKITVYPNAFPDYFTNIVVLRLKEPVKFSESVSPVCLPTKTLKNAPKQSDGDDFYYVSYKLGKTDGVNKKEIIQESRVKASDCEDLYRKKAWSLISPANSASYICVGRNESCRLDDTISPLFRRTAAGWTAAALYHFGPRECGTGLPAASLDVQLYLDWIRTAIAD